MFNFFAQKFSAIFSHLAGNTHISAHIIEQTVQKIKDTLLDADVPVEVVEAFVKEIQHDIVGKKVLKHLKPDEQCAKVVHDKIVQFLGGKSAYEELPKKGSVLVMGLQGAGKTTTVAKVAHFIKQQSKKKPTIAVGSVDFYRPAAVEQLHILCQQANINFLQSHAKNPVHAAQELCELAAKQHSDLVFLDTAGRMHVDEVMIKELQEIVKLINPTYKWLVLDAMTGQESLKIAKLFDEQVGFDAAILTKMDSATRAGAAFAFRYILGKPIILMGTGEALDNIEHFRADRVAQRMLGMGDVQTLIERADQKIEKHEQEQAQQAFARGRITLNDFAQQMSMMNKLGSLSQVMQYIPGIQSQRLSDEQLHKAEQEMSRFRAIIHSMTPKERENHKILDSSRKKRVARGAGVPVEAVNQLLRRFEETQQFVKLFKQMGSFAKF